MVDGAKCNSHNSGGHFKKLTLKMAAERKKSYIFVIELKVQVRLNAVTT